MTLLSTTAFVLRLDPLSEKDLVVVLLTRDNGVVRAAVRGARGRSRRAATLQTLTEASVTLFHREGADLWRADGIETVRSSFPLAARKETAMLLPYIAESLLTFIPESEPGSHAFRLTRHVLDALEAGIPALLAARYFEVWLLRISGLLPETGRCAGCGRELGGAETHFDPEVPGFTGEECAGRLAVKVPAEVGGLLAAMRRSRLPDLAARGEGTAPRAALLSIEELAREVRRRFLGHELKSYRYLGVLG